MKYCESFAALPSFSGPVHSLQSAPTINELFYNFIISYIFESIANSIMPKLQLIVPHSVELTTLRKDEYYAMVEIFW